MPNIAIRFSRTNGEIRHTGHALGEDQADQPAPLVGVEDRADPDRAVDPLVRTRDAGA